jgi:PAS domain S-box-containing protein
VDDFGGQSLHLWIASVPDALVLVDDDGRIIEANAAMASLFGYEQDELLSQPIEMLVPERLRKDHVRQRRKRDSDPRDRPMGSNLPILARRKDGSEFEADIQLCTRRMPSGPATVAIVRDLSAVERLRELEERIVRIRDRLAARLDSPFEIGAASGELREMRAEAERALEILRRISRDVPRQGGKGGRGVKGTGSERSPASAPRRS